MRYSEEQMRAAFIAGGIRVVAELKSNTGFYEGDTLPLGVEEWLAAQKENTCRWTRSSGVFETDCGNAFTYLLDFYYCPYCGKAVVQ